MAAGVSCHCTMPTMATHVTKAMPLRWPFCPAFIGTRAFVRRPPVAWTGKPHSIAVFRRSVRLGASVLPEGRLHCIFPCRCLECCTVHGEMRWRSICYYGEVGADGSRLQLSGVKSGSRWSTPEILRERLGHIHSCCSLNPCAPEQPFVQLVSRRGRLYLALACQNLCIFASDHWQRLQVVCSAIQDKASLPRCRSTYKPSC